MAADETEGERGDSPISGRMTSALKRHMSEMYDDKDASEAAAQPHHTVQAFGGLQTRHQLERHFVEQISVDIGSPMTAFDFTVPSGSRVFGPPYDRDWAEGNGIAFFSRVD